ncbi:hypothetical protein [Pseudoduganella namucuonensis]|uniref:hypothetical protein n=1 Tax=Pseudoduganella namucuonensis TaxID=1035707 RepID=UPI000B880D17|nr:hypothetical protein [Pseudoduganella namucuonensis]
MAELLQAVFERRVPQARLENIFPKVDAGPVIPADAVRSHIDHIARVLAGIEHQRGAGLGVEAKTERAGGEAELVVGLHAM